MELRQLRYFSVLARELNFSRAAQKLFITQGTLSQQIRQLEDEIGSELFDRTSRSVRLTEAGESLQAYAQKTLDASHECMQVAQDLRKGIRGSLNIGVTHSFKNLLRSTAKEFIRLYPDVNLTITYSTAPELHSMLVDRKIDFFLAFKPSAADPYVEYIDLFSSRFNLIMSRNHPLADKKSLTIDELRRYRLAIPAKGLQSRKAFESYIDLNTSGIKVALETNDPNFLIELVSSTNLLAVTSTLAVSYRSDLKAIPLEGVEHKMQGCVLRLKDAYAKRSAEIFLKMLLDSAEIEKVGMDCC